MTIPATTRRAGPYAGDDSATTFPFTFRVATADEVQVIKASSTGGESTLTRGTHYSVTLNGDQATSPGGSVTYPLSGSPLADGETLVLLGAVPYSQTTALPAGGNFAAGVVETAIDQVVKQVQQLAEVAGRALTLPPTLAGTGALPAPVASTLIGWNATRDALRTYTGAELGSLPSGNVAWENITVSPSDKLKIGDPAMFGYPNDDVARIYRNGGTPASIQHTFRVITKGKGDNTTYRGCTNAYFEFRDDDDVGPTTKGVGYALHCSVSIREPRNNVPYDDVVALTLSNTTGVVGASGTDCIYVSENPYAFGDHITGTSEWYSIFTADCNATVGFALGGKIADTGINFRTAHFPTSAAACFGNTHNLYWRNAAANADLRVIGLDANNTVQLGETNTSGVRVNTWLGRPAPVSVTAGTYTVGYADVWVIFNTSGCTVTLPAAGSYPGRELYLRNVTANAVVSASSNVVPRAGGAAGTAILAASAGSWATLVSDGAVWQTMAGS